MKRKLPKVIYVVNRPRPGMNKGDWMVRMHGKILSHHKHKTVAIKHARAEAKKRNYSVLIQKADGTFQKGFHPVPS